MLGNTNLRKSIGVRASFRVGLFLVAMTLTSLIAVTAEASGSPSSNLPQFVESTTPQSEHFTNTRAALNECVKPAGGKFETAVVECEKAMNGYLLSQIANGAKAKQALTNQQAKATKKSLMGTFNLGGTFISESRKNVSTVAKECKISGLVIGRQFFGMGNTSKPGEVPCSCDIEDKLEKETEAVIPKDIAVALQQAKELLKHKETEVEKCETYFADRKKEIEDQANAIEEIGSELRRGMKKVLAVGGAVAVGGIMYKKDQDDKKDKRKKKRDAAEQYNYENGIITSRSGEPIKCFSSQNYQNDECRPTMMRLCQEGRDDTAGGCQAFNGFMCGVGSGNENSGYCLQQLAQQYCQSGLANVVGQSPACQWMSSRPAGCSESPNDIRCLSAMSGDQLKAACGSYPQDPLCQKVNEGVIVSQPSGGVAVLSSTSSTSTSTASTAPPANLWSATSTALSNNYNSGVLTGRGD